MSPRSNFVVPARKISYRSVLLRDLVGFAFWSVYILIPAAQYLSSLYRASVSTPEVTNDLAYSRFGSLLYYVVGDFGAYWMHRLLHSSLSGVSINGIILLPTCIGWPAIEHPLRNRLCVNLPWIFAYSVSWHGPLVDVSGGAVLSHCC